jgi:hypothetical protein
MMGPSYGEGHAVLPSPHHLDGMTASGRHPHPIEVMTRLGGRSRIDAPHPRTMNPKAEPMLLWIFLAAVYLTALFVLGLSTLRKGHTVLFFVGIFFPLLWIVGALMGPTPRAASSM